MEKFLGKIGKYRRMTQHQRSVAYLAREKKQRKMDRQHGAYGAYVLNSRKAAELLNLADIPLTVNDNTASRMIDEMKRYTWSKY
jgi:hypothetical protein